MSTNEKVKKRSSMVRDSGCARLCRVRGEGGGERVTVVVVNSCELFLYIFDEQLRSNVRKEEANSVRSLHRYATFEGTCSLRPDCSRKA